jgi:hypothetical protein
MNNHNKNVKKKKNKKGIHKSYFKTQYYSLKEKHDSLLKDIDSMTLYGIESIAYGVNDHKSFSEILYDLRKLLVKYDYQNKNKKNIELKELV